MEPLAALLAKPSETTNRLASDELDGPDFVTGGPATPCSGQCNPMTRLTDRLLLGTRSNSHLLTDQPTAVPFRWLQSEHNT